MSLAQETTQDHRLTIVPDFTDLGKFEIGQTKELKWSITCPIAKVKVICEQETNVREKEVEKTEFVTFQRAGTKNLIINFKANRGGIVNLAVKVENLKNKTTYSNEDLIALGQRFELKYQVNISNIDVILGNEIVIKEVIGEGGEATINKALFDGEIVDIKTYNPGFGTEESKKMLYFKNKYIVEYKKSFIREVNNQKCFCTMLEYAKYGSLESKKKNILLNNPYYIRLWRIDIKPQNILIFNYQEICDVNAKLTDFGTCDMISSEGNRGNVGTEYFIAPEVVNGEKYTNKCDIYSLGITMLNSFLKIGFGNSIGNDIQPNGTYIKTTAYLKLEILKNFGDREIFESVNADENFRFSLPKFDLFKAVKVVVKSFKELKVTNNFIKGLLKSKFEKNSKEAIVLVKQNQSSLDNKGDADYFEASRYLKKKKPELMMVGYNLMIAAASKSHPDAIMCLVDILMDIDKGKIELYDYEKYQINEIINSSYDMIPELDDVLLLKSRTCSLKINRYKTISTSIIMNIFSVLKKYFPVCEFQYGIALLHGVGIKKSISSAEPIFNRFRESGFLEDYLEVQLYQAYCKCAKNNIQNTYKEAYNMLEDCITYSKNKYYYSNALNNKGMLLYKGLGCKKNIKKAFELFKQSMESNDDHGKFNYALCLYEHKQLLSTKSTREDGMKIIQRLASTKKNLEEARIWCIKALDNNLVDGEIYGMFYGATLQTRLRYKYLMVLKEMYLQNKDQKVRVEIFELIKTIKNTTHESALFELGLCYDEGLVIEKDKKKAIEYFEKAAMGHNKEALYYLGVAYLYGTSVMKDENKAVKYLIFSVKEGETRALKPLEDCNQDIFDFYALFELGTIYLNGISKKGLMVVEKDIKKATNYFERAANKNNIHAHDPLYPTYPSHDTVNQSLNSKSLQGSFDSLDPIYPIYREGNNVEVTRPNNGQAYLKLCEIYLGDGLIPRNLKKAKYCLNEALKCGNINVTHLKKQRPVFCEACNI
ncbi:Protein kinase domain-containing protein [Entamoeba marina]